MWLPRDEDELERMLGGLLILIGVALLAGLCAGAAA